MNRTFRKLVAVALLVVAGEAGAHHSFTMFDMTRSVNVKGTVKELQWTNPHVWVVITVTEGGKATDLSFEGAAIPVIKAAGWLRDSFKAGDTITIAGHPYKDGRPGGCIDYILLADGRKVGQGDNLPSAIVVPGVQ